MFFEMFFYRVSLFIDRNYFRACIQRHGAELLDQHLGVEFLEGKDGQIGEFVFDNLSDITPDFKVGQRDALAGIDVVLP